jgi:hypothetical protein
MHTANPMERKEIRQMVRRIAGTIERPAARQGKVLYARE